MVVITSIFVVEIEDRIRPDNSDHIEVLELDLSCPDRRKALEESGRELISMYEGKNRVEPME
jgi:hypothetical protein